MGKEEAVLTAYTNMICPKCNKENKEGEPLCEFCQSPLTEKDVVESNTATLEESPELKALENTEGPENEELIKLATGKEKPKRRFNWKVLLIVLTPITALAIVIALNFNLVFGYGIKTFGTPTQYLAFVVKNSIEEDIEAPIAMYNNFSERISYDDGLTTNLNLEISNELVSILNTYSSMPSVSTASDDEAFSLDKILSFAENSLGIDLLEGAGISFDVDKKDNLIRNNLALTQNGEKLHSIEFINDSENNELYIGIPELTDSYLKIDTSKEGIENLTDEIIGNTEFDSYAVPLEFRMAMSLFPELINEKFADIISSIMPTEDELEELITDVILAAIDSVTETKMETTTLTVGEISKKVTDISIEVDEEVLLNISKGVLEEIKENSSAKKIVTRIEDVIKEKNAEEFELYDSMYNEIDKAIKDIDKKLNDKDFENRSYMLLHVYVDGWHNIVGSSVKTYEDNGKTTLASMTEITLEDDGNYEYSCEYKEKDTITIEGKGTNKKNIISGEYTLSVNDKELCDFKCDNFNMDTYKEGNLKGSFTIMPSSEIYNQMGISGSAGAFIKGSGFGLKFTFDDSLTKCADSISLVMGDTELIALSYDYAQKESASVKLPDKSTEIESLDDLKVWFMNALV